MNLAQQARAAVSTFLHREVSQQSFSNLTQISIATIRGWEQSKRVPRYSATATLLHLIIQNPEFMVSAFVQIHLYQRFRFEVPLEIATEVVHVILRTDKDEEARKTALLSIARRILRAKKISQQGVRKVVDGILLHVTIINPSRIVTTE